MHKIILFIMVLLWSSASLHAQEKETPNAQQARRMFMETYKMIFGDQGSQLTYNVNIIETALSDWAGQAGELQNFVMNNNPDGKLAIIGLSGGFAGPASSILCV